MSTKIKKKSVVNGITQLECNNKILDADREGSKGLLLDKVNYPCLFTKMKKLIMKWISYAKRKNNNRFKQNRQFKDCKNIKKC